mmetsp:Transcript_108566/g.188546  ORF Transcript_108566/g.188546 Transcript_108566/m.188546 type:complete len:233 (-) Transcript_108566:309-1007(-)
MTPACCSRRWCRRLASVLAKRAALIRKALTSRSSSEVRRCSAFFSSTRSASAIVASISKEGSLLSTVSSVRHNSLESGVAAAGAGTDAEAGAATADVAVAAGPASVSDGASAAFWLGAALSSHPLRAPLPWLAASGRILATSACSAAKSSSVLRCNRIASASTSYCWVRCCASRIRCCSCAQSGISVLPFVWLLGCSSVACSSVTGTDSGVSSPCKLGVEPGSAKTLLRTRT